MTYYVAYEPRFTISPRLLTLVEQISALRERIRGETVELSWIPALQKDRRNGHGAGGIVGGARRIKAGGDGSVASTAGSRVGGKGRN